jgi:hypothetical protein
MDSKELKMDKAVLVSDILEKMREAYEAEGVEGDFDDAFRWYMEDAPLEEIIADHEKWCPKM